MERPQPKTDLYITNAFKGHKFGKNIFPYSPAAKKWIETEGPTFGELYPPETEDDFGDAAVIFKATMRTYYRLLIHRCYDPEEVVNYLLNAYPEWKAENWVDLGSIWDNWDEPEEPIDDNTED